MYPSLNSPFLYLAHQNQARTVLVIVVQAMDFLPEIIQDNLPIPKIVYPTLLVIQKKFEKACTVTISEAVYHSFLRPILISCNY